MEWWKAIVRVWWNQRAGSGCFIAPDLLVTAAHVVHPVGSTLRPELVRIWAPHDATWFPVVSVQVPRRWSSDWHPGADVAIVRIDGRASSWIPPVSLVAPSYPVELYGYPRDSTLAPIASGRVETLDPSGGFPMLYSSELEVRSGQSGSPLLVKPGGVRCVGGVVVADAQMPGTSAFVGLPLADRTFGDLLA